MIYTDEDKIDRRGAHSEPFFKPDWSPELFRGVMYVGHLLFMRRSLVESCGGPDSTFDGVQDFELMLRVSEHTDRIEHVPRILYHWRKLPESVAGSLDAKDGISELQAAAVNGHLERMQIQAVARPNPEFPHRTVIDPKERREWPRVTVIVPTKDAPRHLARCLGSIFTTLDVPELRCPPRRQPHDGSRGVRRLFEAASRRRDPVRRAVQLLAREQPRRRSTPTATSSSSSTTTPRSAPPNGSRRW